MEITKKGDFIEIKFTGYSNGNVFDSNIEEDLKKIRAEAKAEKRVVIIGEGMVVPGLDKALEGKEIGKDYEISLKAKEAFGERNRNLMKTIPLKVFSEKNIIPHPGLALSLDGMIAKIIAISGARVITDFNNPLAGKEVSYKFKIVKKIDDEKEKIENLFEFLLRFKPEFEIKEKIVVKGPKVYGAFVNAYSDKFKQLIGKELAFEIKEEEKDKKEAENGKETGKNSKKKTE